MLIFTYFYPKWLYICYTNNLISMDTKQLKSIYDWGIDNPFILYNFSK